MEDLANQLEQEFLEEYGKSLAFNIKEPWRARVSKVFSGWGVRPLFLILRLAGTFRNDTDGGEVQSQKFPHFSELVVVGPHSLANPFIAGCLVGDTREQLFQASPNRKPLLSRVVG